MGNLPYSFPVKFVEGSDMEHILCRSDYELWEVTGRSEARRVLKYSDVVNPDMQISDVFRMSDGSFGFQITANEWEETMDEGGRISTLIRVSAK